MALEGPKNKPPLEVVVRDFGKIGAHLFRGPQRAALRPENHGPAGAMKAVHANDMAPEIFEVTGFSDILAIE